MKIFRIIMMTCLVWMSGVPMSWAANLHPLTQIELQNNQANPPAIRDLIAAAFALNQQKLAYRYGSSNPKTGGLDCSGTIYYLLSLWLQGDLPRRADEIYLWVKDEGKFYSGTKTRKNLDPLAHLKPGDLLFWTGTYHVHRAVPITHVMLYLGKDKQGNPLMFGASNGRRHHGQGVSIEYFKLTRNNQRSHFIGYGCIPYIGCS